MSATFWPRPSQRSEIDLRATIIAGTRRPICPRGPRSRVTGARFTSGSMLKRWKSGLLRSPAAELAMRPYCPTYWIRSPAINPSAWLRPTAPTTPVPAMWPSRRAERQLSSRPARTANRGKNRQQEQPCATMPVAVFDALAGRSGSDGPAVSTKPGRGQDAMLQALGRARYVPRLRKAGRRASDQGRNPEPLHNPRNAAHAAPSIGLTRHQRICATKPTGGLYRRSS